MQPVTYATYLTRCGVSCTREIVQRWAAMLHAWHGGWNASHPADNRQKDGVVAVAVVGLRLMAALDRPHVHGDSSCWAAELHRGPESPC